MKTFVLGVFSAIALWFREAGIGLNSSQIGSEDSQSIFSDDSSITNSFDEDSPARGMWDITSIYYSMMHSNDSNGSSIASTFDEDSPARGMWDVTSTYYGMMHSDDLHSTGISSDDSWSSSSSSSMFDDSFSSDSSFSNFDD